MNHTAPQRNTAGRLTLDLAPAQGAQDAAPNSELQTPNSELYPAPDTRHPTLDTLEPDLAMALARLDEQGLRRHLSAAEETGPTRLVVEGRCYLNFASNDYLGLAQHPQVRAAAKAAIDQFGVGAGASRLVTGSHRLHAELEAKIAARKRVPRSLTFSSGYAAALGTIPALAGAHAVLPDLSDVDAAVRILRD